MSKRTLLSRAPLYALLVALVLVVPIVLAATVNFSGTVSGSYARPTSPAQFAGNYACGAVTGTSNYGYQAFPFYVDLNGAYTLTVVDPVSGFDGPENDFKVGSTPDKDTFMTLYQGSFDPSAPLTNCLFANDDLGGGSMRSQLVDVNLTTGTQYVMVISSYVPGVTGSFSGTIAGPGTATLGTLPVDPGNPGDPGDPTSPNGAGGGISTVFVGFNPNDGRINPHAYAPVAIYCDAANSRVAIYGINDDGEGFEAIFVPYSELPETPASNLLIEQFGDIRFYRLSTGEYQVSAGPDAEGKEYAAVFDGCPWSYVEAYIFDHLTGMTTLAEVRTR